jgi:hypothetical protein
MVDTGVPTTGTATSRVGSVVLVVLGAALLAAVNVWPGWRAVGFLTEDTVLVLGVVNLSLAAGVVANLAVALLDRPWLHAVGDVLTSALGLLATVRLLQVFPVRFAGSGFDWAVLVRVLLVLGLVGGAIGLVAALVAVVRTVLLGRR